jgi:hypothetical protein
MAALGGPPPMMPPAMGGNGPMPGQGMDPMAAMLGAGGPFGGGPPPMMSPPGGGLPVGGSMPMPGAMDGAGQSPMLAALLGSMGGGMEGMGGMGGDEYGTLPGESEHVFDSGGTGDPNMGLMQLLQMLALAKSGVGGGTPPGGSGVDGQPPNPGVALGLGM